MTLNGYSIFDIRYWFVLRHKDTVNQYFIQYLFLFYPISPNGFLILIFSYSATLCRAQEESKASPPVIVAKILLSETALFEDTAITFKRVIEDSRCPKDVDCIWAGQAKVLVAVKSNGTTTEKELIFHGTNFGTAHENTLFVSESKTYIGYRMSPYPQSSMPSGETSYQLEIYMK